MPQHPAQRFGFFAAVGILALCFAGLLAQGFAGAGQEASGSSSNSGTADRGASSQQSQQNQDQNNNPPQQTQAEQTQAPAEETLSTATKLSDDDKEAVKKAVTDYFAAFSYQGTDAYGYEAQIEKVISGSEWWSSPTGKYVQKQEKDLNDFHWNFDQHYDLDRFEIQQQSSDYVTGQAVYHGYSNLGGQHSGPQHLQNELRLRKTDAGWKAVYAGSGSNQ